MTTVTITVTVDAEGEVRLGLPTNGANGVGRAPRREAFADELVPLPLDAAQLRPITTIGPKPGIAGISRVCPIHGVPWRRVPPGISKKTGRPYDGFEACGEPSCPERPR